MSVKIDRVLQKDILSLMLKDPNLVLRLKRVVEPSYFSIRSYRFCCKRIFRHFDKHDGELPSERSMLININKRIDDGDKRKEYKKKIVPLFKRKVESPKGISEEIYEWAEKQKFGIILEDAARRGAEGDLDSAKSIIKSSFLFDTIDSEFKVYSVLEEWKKRQRERKKESKRSRKLQIKTGLGPLDNYLKIKKYQNMLALIMGTSGVGKSIMSINFGVFALNAGCNVAHFVFENTARQTLARYDSRLVEYPYHYLDDYNWTKKDLANANRVMRSLRRKRRHCLKVIHAPIETVNVMDIETLFKELETKEGWIPDFTIYDSGDHVLPTEKQESYRLSVKKAYTDIMRQSEIRDMPILCTTHAKASARGTRLRQESFSEAYDKARLADVVLTISQTQEQEDDWQAELWLDKWRDGEGRIGILIDLLFRVMTIQFIERVGEDDGE